MKNDLVPLHLRPDMENTKTAIAQPKIKGLRDLRRKAVDTESLVKTATIEPGQALPLIVEPAVRLIDLAEWTGNNREFIDSHLLKHGAILFRGFGLDSAVAFERV